MTSFPAGLDIFTNPGALDDLENANPDLDHATQHSNANDAIEALEAKVGVDSSAVVGSLDYRLRKGGAIRTAAALTTESLAAGTTDSTKTLALGKGCHAIAIETDHPAWVRVYATEAAQLADAARLQTVDPVDEHGVLLEVITTDENLALVLSPAAMCYSAEDIPVATLPVTVTNLDTATRVIVVTTSYIPLEG